ncbi:MAG: hypothetical protein ACRYFS_14165, partial [Janthinobacterium lividum]
IVYGTYNPRGVAVTNGPTDAYSSTYIFGSIQQDNREITLSASIDATSKKSLLLDASGNQTSDANGDLNYTGTPNVRGSDGAMHGDTLYTYHNFVSQSPAPGSSIIPPPIDTGEPNWVYFTPTFVGGWHWKAGTTQNGDSITVPDVVAPDTWIWSPNESEDTWDYGKCSMPWAAKYTQLDGNASGQDTPTSYNVSYTATDNTDQANAVASYMMTVHDPLEKNYPDHTQRIINNIRPVPNVVYARAGYDGQPLTVNVAVGDAWTVTGTLNVPVALASWVASAIGVNIQVSHQASFSAGVTSTVSSPYTYNGVSYTVHQGDETYMEKFDEHVSHYGKADTWGANGYSGTQAYSFLVPDNPAGGYQPHLPLVSSISR